MSHQTPSSRPLWQFIGLLWAIELIDQTLLNRQLDGLGLQPGNWKYWQGILLMPFLHSDLYHLLNNTIGLVVFGLLLRSKKKSYLYPASIGAILGCGLTVLLLGTPGSIHIGASGLVFGWWSFLIAMGFYQRNFRSVLVALLVIIFFGGMIYGVLPGQTGISWQGHLGGAIGGVAAARFTFNKGRKSP